MTYYHNKVYDQSAFSELLPKAISKAGKRIAAVWNKATDDASAEKVAANAVQTETKQPTTAKPAK